MVFVAFETSSGADAFLWRSGRFGASFIFLGFRNIWDVFGCWFSYLTSLLVWRELHFPLFSEHFGHIRKLGLLWAALGLLWALLWGVLWLPWGVLGLLWGVLWLLWGVLGLLCDVLGLLWGVLGLL